MERFPYPEPVDKARYAPDASRPEVFYGLPGHVSFCATCGISNQRPNSCVEFEHTRESTKDTIHFDKDGVCDACRVAEAKNTLVDWDERERQLAELCETHRSADGSYDCLVPGSGGKDSFYAAHKLKYEYGMHPLTVTWAPHIYTDWGWRNFQRWIHAGFDNYLMTPSGRTHRLLTRLAVENLLHPFQPFILGQKNLAPKIALKFGIPLIFYGESEAEYGNPQDQAMSSQRDWAYYVAKNRDELYLAGTSWADLIEVLGVPEADLQPYIPAHPEEIVDLAVEVHYLGYYLRWHPQGSYYYAHEHGGFEASPERTPGTYSKYNSIDDKIDDLHYYTTYIKFGIGRATYDASQETRSGDITYDEAVALVQRFDGEYPERFMDSNLLYLSLPESEFPQASKYFEQPVMDRAYFTALCDRFRSPHLWAFDGEWKLRHALWHKPA